MDAKENLALLVKDLFGEDELGAVIRAHIRIESLLHRIIELKASNPKPVKNLELDFDKAVTLALVLGLKEDFGPSLRALGKLRNDFAHKPDMKLTKSAVNNVYKTFNKLEKEHIQTAFKDIKKENETVKQYHKFSDLPESDQLRFLVTTIWASVQSAVVILENEKKV